MKQHRLLVIFNIILLVVVTLGGLFIWMDKYGGTSSTLTYEHDSPYFRIEFPKEWKGFSAEESSDKYGNYVSFGFEEDGDIIDNPLFYVQIWDADEWFRQVTSGDPHTQNEVIKLKEGNQTYIVGAAGSHEAPKGRETARSQVSDILDYQIYKAR